MRYLREQGFTTLSLDRYVDFIDGGPKPQQRYIAITFDDGFMDNYTEAFPILDKCGFTATIFLVSDYMGRIKDWGDQKGINLMTWEQAREMSHHGIVFQSHTRTHPDLAQLTDAEAVTEFRDSKMRIEDEIGLPVNHFAYPYGRWNPRLIELLKNVGYRSAYASGMAEFNTFSIERFECHESFRAFKIKTSPWSSWLRNIYHLPEG